MDGFRPVRSLIRGLDILTALNRISGGTVSEISRETGLSRGTAYRMLETLQISGYVIRDAGDSKYRLLVKVRDLSHGFKDSDWVPRAAKPIIDKLCDKIIWPISVATFTGTSMILRETTDSKSPLALRRLSGGFELPMFESAAGRVYLAFSRIRNTNTLISLLQRIDPQNSVKPIKNIKTFKKTLEDIKIAGYAIVIRSDLRQSVLAVPILVNGKIFATLAMRYMESTMSSNEAVKKYLVILQKTANDIAQNCEEYSFN